MNITLLKHKYATKGTNSEVETSCGKSKKKIQFSGLYVMTKTEVPE